MHFGFYRFVSPLDTRAKNHIKNTKIQCPKNHTFEHSDAPEAINPLVGNLFHVVFTDGVATGATDLRILRFCI